MRYGRRPGVDLGVEYSAELNDFAVNALVLEDAVCHLGVVPREIR
jgi:hypothetical protein